MRIAFFGGIYNNYLALAAAIEDASLRGAERMYCLGDLGAFGPHPDRVFPLLRDNQIECVQGNYDHSIGNDLQDCQCGYTDPRDNWFAQISYNYTYVNTSLKNRHWMRALPSEIRFEVDGIRFLLCHGSPRKTNEFLWESTTSTHFLERLFQDAGADVVLGTHSGIHWQRQLNGNRRFINVGVLGRPENDGSTNVWYTILDTSRAGGDRAVPPADMGPVEVEFVPLLYDHERLAMEMRQEELPPEFISTIREGWWTTCLEVLPGKERGEGRY
ncbi:MAG: metallophosphoesterase family protein [Planctomycetota bacterium]|nr:metallophosphoesterase family protein [Planctomycetota bacterium]MDA1162233.1 metallophosphoesterase family protein [Planctomycetota bacterium]